MLLCALLLQDKVQLSPHHFAASSKGKAAGRGGCVCVCNLGDLKGDLRAIYTRCVSICSAIMVWQSGTGCASGVGSVCRVSLHLTGLVNGTHFGKIIESVRLSFLLPS